MSLWGYYFATGSYGPMMRHRRDAALVGRSRRCRAAHHRQHGEIHAGQQRHARSGIACHAQEFEQGAQSAGKTVAALNEVTDAAETVDTARIRKQAIAAIDELKTQGPGLQARRHLVGLCRPKRDCRRLHRRRRHRACRTRPALRDRRRRDLGGDEFLEQPAVIDRGRASGRPRTPLVSWLKSSKNCSARAPTAAAG